MLSCLLHRLQCTCVCSLAHRARAPPAAELQALTWTCSTSSRALGHRQAGACRQPGPPGPDVCAGHHGQLHTGGCRGGGPAPGQPDEAQPHRTQVLGQALLHSGLRGCAGLPLAQEPAQQRPASAAGRRSSQLCTAQPSTRGLAEGARLLLLAGACRPCLSACNRLYAACSASVKSEVFSTSWAEGLTL